MRDSEIRDVIGGLATDLYRWVFVLIDSHFTIDEMESHEAGCIAARLEKEFVRELNLHFDIDQPTFPEECKTGKTDI